MSNETLVWALVCGFIGWGCWLWGWGCGIGKGWESGYEFCLKRCQKIAQDTLDELEAKKREDSGWK